MQPQLLISVRLGVSPVLRFQRAQLEMDGSRHGRWRQPRSMDCYRGGGWLALVRSTTRTASVQQTGRPDDPSGLPLLSSASDPASARSLLSSEIVEIPLELRGSLCGIVGQTTRTRSRPQLSVLAWVLSGTITIALVDPVPLGLLESILELGPTRFPCLGYQLLVGAIQIGIVRSYRAVQAGALIDSRGRVARIARRRLRIARRPLRIARRPLGAGRGREID